MHNHSSIYFHISTIYSMVSIMDFEYSYKVFTPLENLTETGFVAKFVRRDEFDLELSVKFAKYKVRFFYKKKYFKKTN